MKKLISVLMVLALVVSVVFAQGAFFFNNTIKTKVVDVAADGSTSLGKTYEEMEAGFFTEKLDIYAKGRVLLNSEGTKPVSIGYDPSETYFGIGFKPGYGTFVGIGQDMKIPGSYLYVEDDNVAAGKILSPGLSVGYRGTFTDGDVTHGINVGSTFDFISGVYNNYFVDANGNYIFNTGCGAYYSFAKEDSVSATIGANYRYSVSGANPHSFGVYGTVSYAGLEVLGGFSYNSDAIYASGNTVNASVYYEYESLWVCADYVTDFNDTFYYGAAVGYAIPEDVEKADFEVSAWMGAYDATYSNYVEDTSYVFGPSLSVSVEKYGKFVVGADITVDNAGFASVNFPCKWKYSF